MSSVRPVSCSEAFHSSLLGIDVVVVSFTIWMVSNSSLFLRVSQSLIYLVKVHLTPKIFFAKIIRLILWSNLAKKFFDLVKSSNFYAP